MVALPTLLVLAAFSAAPPVHSLPCEIARWIEELGDDSFAVRESASKKLQKAGEAAEPALNKALDSPDAEVVKRAKTILAEFKWGIYPETPERIVELIRSYRSSAPSEKSVVLRKLLDTGAPGCRAMIKIARAEDDPRVRKEVFAGIAANLSRSAPALLEENNRTSLESLLEVALASEARGAILHYTAYHLLTGQLPARIVDWQAQAKKAVVAKAELEVLAYLYRARGDWARARKAAIGAERLDLLEAFLYEQPDWAELANQSRLPETPDTVRYISYRAAYSRLGGMTKRYDNAIDDLITRGKALADDRSSLLPHAKGLFLNGKPNEAIELLKRNDTNARMVFEILIVQNKVKEALALVETARKSSWMLLPVLEIHEARIRYHLGEKDKALATLKKYTEAIKKDVSLTWVVELVDAELAIGRRDQALAVTARMMTIQPAGNWQTTLFEKLFDKQADDAGLLWRLLRSFEPKEPFDKSLARLSAFLEGKASARDVSVLLDRFGKEKFVEAYPREPKEIWRVLGEVALVGKQPERAIEAFRKGGPGGLVRIGDMLAQKKQWAAAAVEYHGAYKQGLQGNLSQGISAEALPCLALWLSGHALTQAGRASEGKAQMERAHLLPLGDAQMRFDFLRVLRRRGHREAARIEADLLRRTGEPSLGDPESYYTGEGLRTAAIEAASKKDWLKAADGYEQTFLRCLHPSMNFARAPAYVSVPSHIFLTRARGLLAAGKIDEALVETERARAMQPGNVEIAMHLVPELDRLGKKKEADALYKAIRDTYMVVIREYANSAFSRNQVAWLSACCRRDLDEALKHVRRAIELTPDSAAYHDTLAEVLFQLGKKDEAIAAQKKAIVLNPTRDYFKKQLKRLEAGDPRTPRPEEE